MKFKKLGYEHYAIYDSVRYRFGTVHNSNFKTVIKLEIAINKPTVIELIKSIETLDSMYIYDIVFKW